MKFRTPSSWAADNLCFGDKPWTSSHRCLSGNRKTSWQRPSYFSRDTSRCGSLHSGFPVIPARCSSHPSLGCFIQHGSGWFRLRHPKRTSGSTCSGYGRAGNYLGVGVVPCVSIGRLHRSLDRCGRLLIYFVAWIWVLRNPHPFYLAFNKRREDHCTHFADLYLLLYHFW
jgi:hypothetical protein